MARFNSRSSFSSWPLDLTRATTTLLRMATSASFHFPLTSSFRDPESFSFFWKYFWNFFANFWNFQFRRSILRSYLCAFGFYSVEIIDESLVTFRPISFNNLIADINRHRTGETNWWYNSCTWICWNFSTAWRRLRIVVLRGCTQSLLKADWFSSQFKCFTNWIALWFGWGWVLSNFVQIRVWAKQFGSIRSIFLSSHGFYTLVQFWKTPSESTEKCENRPENFNLFFEFLVHWWRHEEFWTFLLILHFFLLVLRSQFFILLLEKIIDLLKLKHLSSKPSFRKGKFFVFVF